MGFRVVALENQDWITRPHEPGEPARHVAELSDPPERHDVGPGGLIHVDAGTALQTANHGDEDLLVYAYGYPPEDENATLLD